MKGNTKRYDLYRAKFIKPIQEPLLAQGKTPSDIFLEAIESKPEFKKGKTNNWKIANVRMSDDLSGTFAVGRTTTTTIEKLDQETGNFINTLSDSAPHSIVFFNAQFGLLAIPRNSKLNSVANRLTDLFSSTRIVQDTGVKVIIDVIPDPQGFIKKLQAAYKIKNFTATFTGPNPIDADELFQKPLSVYAQNMNAEKGKLEVVGESLDANTAESVAKSTAATGNTAKAQVISEKGRKAHRISMQGDAVSFNLPENNSEKKNLEIVLSEYLKVRE